MVDKAQPQFPVQILHLSTQPQPSPLHNLATQFKKTKGGKKTLQVNVEAMVFGY